jgi:hypothetical protein
MKVYIQYFRDGEWRLYDICDGLTYQLSLWECRCNRPGCTVRFAVH